MKKVAVITRTKNRPLLLKRAYESVKCQSFQDLIWVIVNDGGTREEVDLIAALAKEEGIEVSVIHNEISEGMEAASNKGIKASQSKYIIIHDDDDSWETDFLEITINFLEDEKNSCYEGVVTQCNRIDEKLDSNQCVQLAKYPFNKNLRDVYLADIAKHNSFPPISFIYKRSIYDEIGGYNEQLPVLGDWEFNLRFLIQGNIGVIPKCLANYHFRPEQSEGAYGNTVVDGVEKHLKYDVLIRNELLREDILQNKIGLGYLVNLERDHIQIQQDLKIKGGLYQDLRELVRKYGMIGMFRKILRK